jgi:hypothetical protein
MWVRRIGSTLVALPLLFLLITLLFGVVSARPIDPVRIDGTLTRFVPACGVPADAGAQCAFIDANQFCYRVHPDNFQPSLPSLSSRIGQPIAFVVDKENYDTSRTLADPYCNFEVGRIILFDSGREAAYSTRAMTEQQYLGSSRSELIGLSLPVSLLVAALVAWNTVMEIRGYRRRHPSVRT